MAIDISQEDGLLNGAIPICRIHSPDISPLLDMVDLVILTGGNDVRLIPKASKLVIALTSLKNVIFR